MIPTPPTGISTIVYDNSVEINWMQNPETDIQGYNVYNSTTSGGGVSGYVKLNDVLVETYSQIQKSVLSSQQQTQQNGSTVVTVTTEQVKETPIYSYKHSDLTANLTQYYVVTAVNNIGEEGAHSIEVKATPFAISTVTVNAPIRTQNDIALDYITQLLERDANLDVKPSSDIRQLHVDPNSNEMHYAFIRQDFAMRSQSLMTLRELDDSDNDRISDPVSTSSYKQLLMQAYFFTDDGTNVQNLIDASFDAISSNYGVVRQGATQSSTNVTFYTSTIPSVDINIALNSIVSTVPTELQSAISFKTLSSATMYVNTISNYYNPITQLYEIVLPVQAVNTGVVTNVSANTITSSISGLSVTNKTNAFGGSDKESNADLADRTSYAFIGLDVGTKYGYQKTCAGIENVSAVVVVTAGDPLMQRDYDEVRHKHVFGKVDVYIKGGENAQVQDQVGFIYLESIGEAFTVTNNVKMILTTTNELVISSKPIFFVEEVRNVTHGKDYDIFGNWEISKNSIVMKKQTEVTVDLVSGVVTFVLPLLLGDIISSTYRYKQTVINEVLISSASGGEVSFTLLHSPVVKRSYVITKTSASIATILVEGTDYNLNLLNGQLTLTHGLTIGDALAIGYKYQITITNEIVVASALGGEFTAQLANANIVESMLIGLNGISIELDNTNTTNVLLGMSATDMINVTYSYRDSNAIPLLVQPAESIISITGSISGVLTPEINYTFNKIDDILLDGNSSKANRTVSIHYANNIPVGALQNTTQNITLINNEYKQLDNFGVDTQSIKVRLNNTTYSIGSDYLVLPEQKGNKVQIARSRNSTIPNGVQITVAYRYGEILTIVYNANPLVDIVQNVVNVTRHVTADVLVKEVLQTYVDFNISVVLKTGANSIQVISDINTALGNTFAKLQLGDGIAQSDIISVLENVNNVKSVVVPLNKMVKANGTQINREPIGSTFNVYQINTVVSYTTGPAALFQNTLGSSAADGFYAIFENDVALVLVSSANDVDSASGQGFIGSDGSITISTINNDNPTIHNYTVSYVVNDESGAKDIAITSLEYLSVGEVVVTTA